MTSIRRELEGYGITPRKRWGQNFLTDRNIMDKIIRTAQVGPEDVILEVGPGLGEMTLALARQARRVIAVEIDPKLVEILKEKKADYPNMEVIRGDVLEIDFRELLGKGEGTIKVVANLPYQISTPLLFRFMESRDVFSSLTLMLQKEVAERLVASPGGKDYGPLSILVQWVATLSICFAVKPSAFFPAPKVASAVVRMVWREKPVVELEDEEWFKTVVKGSMGYRRKTLINALKHSSLILPTDPEERMNQVGIDPQRRPETLTVEEFARLAIVLRR